MGNCCRTLPRYSALLCWWPTWQGQGLPEQPQEEPLWSLRPEAQHKEQQWKLWRDGELRTRQRAGQGRIRLVAACDGNKTVNRSVGYQVGRIQRGARFGPGDVLGRGRCLIIFIYPSYFGSVGSVLVTFSVPLLYVMNRIYDKINMCSCFSSAICHC